MKRWIPKTFATFGLFAILGAASARAQSAGDMTANIPFEFDVGGRVLPAGTYRVERIDLLSPHPSVLLKGQDGRTSVVALFRDGERRGTGGGSRLVFNRYGELYLLKQILEQGRLDPSGVTDLARRASPAPRAENRRGPRPCDRRARQP